MNLLKLTCLCCVFALGFGGCSKPTGNYRSFVSQTYAEPLVLNTVTEVYDHPSGCGEVYLPADTLSAIPIDINGDGMADYEIQSEHWYDEVSASGPCANYHYARTVQPLHDTCQVAFDGYWYEVLPFQSGDAIGPLQDYFSFGMLFLEANGAGWGGNFLDGTAYVGIRTGTSEAYHYGWILVSQNGPEITLHGHKWCEQPHQRVVVD